MRLVKPKISLLIVLCIFYITPALSTIGRDMYIGKSEIPTEIWGRNPFLTPKEESTLKGGVLEVEEREDEEEQKANILSNLKLEAIFYSPNRKTAIINGQIVKPGDRILGCEILNITPDSVDLEIERQRCTLPLQGVIGE